MLFPLGEIQGKFIPSEPDIPLLALKSKLDMVKKKPFCHTSKIPPQPLHEENQMTPKS
jgi:hypothetical protein